VLVLALDTATPVVTAGLVDLPADGGPPSTRAARAHDGRKHGELLMPAVRELCDEAGVALGDLGAVVAGVGPGPFTGLRVGIVSAAALGDALGVPVHGVCSLDAIALSVADGTGGTGGNLLVVTDARRREVYWAAYDAEPGDARRLTGPSVEAPLVLADRLPELGVARAVGDPSFAATLGIDVGAPHAPAPAGLVAAAAGALRSGASPAPLEPLYLRRPDAQEPTGRKRVTAR
jgi:tRNA threonylcarbamoyl adenosine modification protein YeaZ